jgi:hypothetical protein
MPGSTARLRCLIVSGRKDRDRTRRARTSYNDSGTVHEYGNRANPSRCPESCCSNEGLAANLSQKGRANDARRLQSIGNTQIVRPAGSPRISHVDGCERPACSPDRQFSIGAAATLTLVSLIQRHCGSLRHSVAPPRPCCRCVPWPAQLHPDAEQEDDAHESEDHGQHRSRGLPYE